MILMLHIATERGVSKFQLLQMGLYFHLVFTEQSLIKQYIGTHL